MKSAGSRVRTMKCSSCGGRLEGPMTVCNFCGVCPDIDLRQIHFIDLGPVPGMQCPGCRMPLDRLQISTGPPVEIERCAGCHGIFFNPGELELLLNDQSHPVVWLDPEAMAGVVEQFHTPAEVVYRRCPVCSEFMNRVNFGGRSGVIIDRCRDGVWLDGGEFQQLARWWRTGGKLRHQVNEIERVRRLEIPARPREAGRGTIDPSTGDAMDNAETAVTVLAVLGGLITHLLS